MPAAITCKNVSFAYDGVPVLEDVNIAIQERSSVCIVGPNGGGKSTLLKLILGLLSPNRGEIQVFGQAPERVTRRTGYVPQHFQCDSLFPVSVLEVTLMGRLGNRWLGLYGKDDRIAAFNALEQVGLQDVAGRNFSTLSGGQRQRALIARALCAEPDLLILDEATSGVDAVFEAKVLDLLHSLNKRMTIIMVSHDLGFVSGMVETVLCVNRCVVEHPTTTIDDEVIQRMYGGDVRMVRHDIHCTDRGHHHD